MLELDRLHRTRSPLGPMLRGKMRWVAADANRCDYAAPPPRPTSAARAGRSTIADLKGWAATAGLPEAERAAPRRSPDKMTLDADTVTDAEVARAASRSTASEKLVAMVLLLAYANFQDRLLLALGLADRSRRAARPRRGPLRPRRDSRHPSPRGSRPEGLARPAVPIASRRPGVGGARLRRLSRRA